MFDLRIPVATYRVQFNQQFRFEDAHELVPYLHRLGVSDLYASPILKARKASSHGYDVVDPSCLNPELGSEADFDVLAQKLKDHGMGLLLDIVPNHMATSPENPWWMDLLENGLCSPYASFFDIEWDPPHGTLKNKVLLPILGSPLDQALENQELTLTLDDIGLFIQYHGYRLPLCIESYSLVIGYRLNALKEVLGCGHPDFQQLNQLVNTVNGLASVTSLDPPQAGKHYRERQAAKESFLHIVKTSSKTKTILLQNITFLNGKKGVPRSFELMDNLLKQQAYQLDFWKTARKHLNYRRFFDISDLICVRVEESHVFKAVHSLIFRLVREGKVSGLRIDHIDGLNDPFQYLYRLQQHIVPEMEGASALPHFYVVVEKILSGDEVLPSDWLVFGTTGYDFANMVNALFLDGRGVQALDEIYSRFTGSQVAFDDVVYKKKRQVINQLFPGEVNALGHLLAYLADQDSRTADLSPVELTKAISELTACLPIYRTYTRKSKVSLRDKLYLERAIDKAKWRNPNIDAVTINFLQRILTLDFPHYLTSNQKEAWLHFILRWQQLTGAVMAKGFEDTALYSYNRLISLNEVGGEPDSLGLSIDDFHRRNLAQLELWPYTLNTTSTHDTKRSEDVRARIDVLSEIPEKWGKTLTRWSERNQPKKPWVNGLPVPEPNTEMLLYQTLLGAWPLCEEEVPDFKERLKAYMVKAVREAKVHTNWLSPNLDYESALVTFLESILESSKQNKFLADFLLFEQKIAYYGMLNSLAQVLLKTTCPGVPDFYQGTELWDFSLVDPDNRRPVDFAKRRRLLDDLIRQEVRGQQSLARQVLSSWEDGRVKLYVTCKALNCRSSYRDVFRDGQYIPLQVVSRRERHVLSFARHKDGVWALVVVPRLLSKLVDPGTLPLGNRAWRDDLLLLPEDTPESWLNVLTAENLKVCVAGRRLPLSDILSIFPVALLVSI